MPPSHSDNYRPVAPPSPSSPPLMSTKVRKEYTGQPQTPNSPLSMSTPTQQNVSPISNIPTSSAITNSQGTFPTSPPLTIAVSAQNSQQPTTMANTLPTPGDSAAGTAPAIGSDGEALAIRDLDLPEDRATPLSLGKRRREDESDGDASPIKDKRRKRGDRRSSELDDSAVVEEGDAMSLGAEKAAEPATGRNWLANGLGEAWMHEPYDHVYLSCTMPHPMTRPHPSEDLISLYGLKDIADSVARTIPSGEKKGEKNKLRKTYKVHMDKLGIAGKHQEVKHPEGTPGSLPEIMAWPDEEWNIQKASGLNMETGLSESVLSRLGKALKLEPGPMPNFDASILALDVPSPTPTVAPTSASASRGQTQINGAIRPTGTGANERPRPTRTGTKRRYDDHSFEGYGEGFVDDDLENGYESGSGGEGRKGGPGRKRRRKSDFPGPTSPPGLGDRSSGFGMVGVGSGIGAYGR